MRGLRGWRDAGWSSSSLLARQVGFQQRVECFDVAATDGLQQFVRTVAVEHAGADTGGDRAGCAKHGDLAAFEFFNSSGNKATMVAKLATAQACACNT